MVEVFAISRRTLHDEVVQGLRTMLVEGRIPPGAKLNERELCALLSVSRTPLREAIKRMAAEGLVDLLPNRGAVAVKLSETANVTLSRATLPTRPEVLVRITCSISCAHFTSQDGYSSPNGHR